MKLQPLSISCTNVGLVFHAVAEYQVYVLMSDLLFENSCADVLIAFGDLEPMLLHEVKPGLGWSFVAAFCLKLLIQPHYSQNDHNENVRLSFHC